MRPRFLLHCLVGLCSFWAAGAAAENPVAPIQVVLTHVEVFNRHDADALAQRVSEDFIWYTVTSDATKVETQGREKFREGMKGYFKSVPDVSSKVEGVTAAGPFVSFRETATWTSKTGKRSLSSIGIYEIRDGLIVRAWYYPAAR
jgi:hypothetical protein